MKLSEVRIAGDRTNYRSQIFCLLEVNVELKTQYYLDVLHWAKILYLPYCPSKCKLTFQQRYVNSLSLLGIQVKLSAELSGVSVTEQ